MKIKVICRVVFLMLLSLPGFVSGQKGGLIHFPLEQHNFGQIREGDGEVFHEFVFKNRGEEPLKITAVNSGGGLRVKDYSRTPVMPGDSGKVSVIFNPGNLHGRFNRTITVSSTGDPPVITLRLLGEVIPREVPVEELYPNQIGPLRLKSTLISFGTVSPGQKAGGELEILNNSDDTVVVSFSDVPAHIDIEADPPLLPAGGKGVLKATWSGDQIDDWGVSTSYCRMLISDSAQDRNIIYLSAHIREDFSALTDEERADAPVISFLERVIDFGKLKQGDTAECEFVFSNTGRSELIIRRIRSGCGCTIIEPEKSVLQAGETGIIKAKFISAGYTGKQNKSITLISNDPVNSTLVLRITGEVFTE